MADLPQIYVALNRLGFGAQMGEVQKIAAQGGAAHWVDRQISQGGTFAAKLAGNHSDSGRIFDEFQKSQQIKDREQRNKVRRQQRLSFQEEMVDRVQQAITSPMPFAERIVHFWSNHFTVSGQSKAAIMGILGAYEREAIRPHAFGRFEDLLIAAEMHPAMLIYLDNQQSTGPNSIAGKRRNRGLNENLAREILELHTLGVNGGYTQQDVIGLAQIITGWGVRGGKQDGPAGFRYQTNFHEPGRKKFMGRLYGTDKPYKNTEEAAFLGAQEGRAALRDLARHPSTARFVATKLARHFISDTPPTSAITALEQNFLQTGGDLASLYRTLAYLPELWEAAFSKYKSPHDYLITVLRMCEMDLKTDKVVRAQVQQALNMMDHKPFMALSPAGWGDSEQDWLSPDSLMNRIDWVHSFTNRFQEKMVNSDPKSFAKETIGTVATATELIAIGQAPSKADGFALTLLSATVMRR